MCGIIGANANHDVTQHLLTGLSKLEYRGYDSAGLTVLNTEKNPTFQRHRCLGKVNTLSNSVKETPISGHIGIAHTRWATHGKVTTHNAHPQHSNDQVALVHNGIIENHAALRAQLKAAGYHFTSETDTEVIAHLIDQAISRDPTAEPTVWIRAAINQLKGAYALGILLQARPNHLFAVRSGSPLVVGIDRDAHFIASDALALTPMVNQLMYLEDGDIACLSPDALSLIDATGQPVTRPIYESEGQQQDHQKGPYKHFMLKEIMEQPTALAHTLAALSPERLTTDLFGPKNTLLRQIKRIQIIACGSSYHAAATGQSWIEALAQIPCRVHIASEYRYQHKVIEPDTLLLCLSQSGETADTLATLREANTAGFLSTIAICNVKNSAITQLADYTLVTEAGPEVGVAATKTFTTQLCALLSFAMTLAEHQQAEQQCPKTSALLATAQQASATLPDFAQAILEMSEAIYNFSKPLHTASNALFLARNSYYPIAQEGALKLKEITYIHAESYPAGELKHGPLALIDDTLPIIILCPDHALKHKIRTDIDTLLSRHANLLIITDEPRQAGKEDKHTLYLPTGMSEWVRPILFTLPLQLIAYQTAVEKGTDVDQPRHLAKSVTVE